MDTLVNYWCLGINYRYFKKIRSSFWDPIYEDVVLMSLSCGEYY